MRVHSLLSPKCHTDASPSGGKGVFASEPIAEGEVVAVWGGKVYTSVEVTQLARVIPHFDTHTVSLCNGYYLGSENLFQFDDAELFNHSCEPNVGVKGQVVLVSRRLIAAGEALTFDYDTTEASATPFVCRCGSPICRGTIDGSGWKDPEFIERNRNYLSWHIEELLRHESTHPNKRTNEYPNTRTHVVNRKGFRIPSMNNHCFA